MKQQRVVVLFGAFLMVMFGILGRLYLLAQNIGYAQNAREQSTTTLTLERRRGDFYDCNGHNLTRYGTRYYALSIPGESSYAQLFSYTSYEGQTTLYKKRNAITPFLVEVNQDLSHLGIYTYQGAHRYYPLAIAQHLIGYLDGEGSGVAGLEAAFDELLLQNRQPIQIECVTTATGQLLEDIHPVLTQQEELGKGVMLTLDQAIQRVCEAIAQQAMQSGAILVMETSTGKVRASVSMPEFDPHNVQASIQANDTSLLNRVFCAYNVGSVFKPFVAAAALEQGVAPEGYQCEGVLEISGHLYHCAQHKSHGLVDMTQAMAQSCNGYFIQLGLTLGANKMYQMASQFGFGQPLYLAGGLQSASGTLPDETVLKNVGQLASMSFGQGQLMAAPVQLAAAFNTIAADGIYRSPSFLEGIVDERTGQLTESLYQPQVKQVISAQVAQKLRQMLTQVVQEGTGQLAQPTHGNAAGKTGTAQTGRYNEQGQEKMNHWFTGFYPAENPQYTIVVLQDDQASTEVSSSTIFAQVCNALYWLLDEEERQSLDELTPAPEPEEQNQQAPENAVDNQD